MPKWNQQLRIRNCCKRRAASTAKEIPDVENVESVKRKCRSHWRGLDCGYRPERKRKPTVFWGRPEKGAFQTRDAGIVTCSRLFLTRRFSLSRRASFAVAV